MATLRRRSRDWRQGDDFGPLAQSLAVAAHFHSRNNNFVKQHRRSAH
jgi:hypothetical protein